MTDLRFTLQRDDDTDAGTMWRDVPAAVRDRWHRDAVNEAWARSDADHLAELRWQEHVVDDVCDHDDDLGDNYDADDDVAVR